MLSNHVNLCLFVVLLQSNIGSSLGLICISSTPGNLGLLLSQSELPLLPAHTPLMNMILGEAR